MPKHALDRAKNNSYSESRKEAYQDYIFLFEEVEKTVQLTLQP